MKAIVNVLLLSATLTRSTNRPTGHVHVKRIGNVLLYIMAGTIIPHCQIHEISSLLSKTTPSTILGQQFLYVGSHENTADRLSAGYDIIIPDSNRPTRNAVIERVVNLHGTL